MRFISALAVTLFLLPAVARADQFQDGQEVLARKQIAELQEAAKQGNAPVQYSLARDYLYLKNYDEAAGWFRKAAEKGIGNAQMSLGKLYLDGKGVKQDHAEAYFWLLLAPHYFNDEIDEVFDPKDAAQHLTPEQKAAVRKAGGGLVAGAPSPVTKANTQAYSIHRIDSRNEIITQWWKEQHE